MLRLSLYIGFGERLIYDVRGGQRQVAAQYGGRPDYLCLSSAKAGHHAKGYFAERGLWRLLFKRTMKRKSF